MRRKEPADKALDLRRLRYFVAVAEAASFRRAAERLGVAQPPISQQIIALEAQLGERLFVRHPRHVELTDAGRALLAEAGPLLVQADMIPQRVRRACEGREGRLCIGFTPAAALHPLLPIILRVYRAQAPGVDIVFREADGVPLCDAVAEGNIQVAFVRPVALRRDRLLLHELVTEPVLVAVPPGHRLAARSKLTLSDIAREDIVLFERSLAPELYDAIVASFNDAGLPLRIVHHAPQKASAMMLAAGGAGLTLVPASLQGIHAGSLALLPTVEPLAQASIAVAVRDGDHGVLTRKFLQVARSQAARWHRSDSPKP